MEHYSTIKKEQTTDTPANWVNFKGAGLSERIQSQELRCYIIPFRGRSWKENCSGKIRAVLARAQGWGSM